MTKAVNKSTKWLKECLTNSIIGSVMVRLLQKTQKMYLNTITVTWLQLQLQTKKSNQLHLYLSTSLKM